jgi:hypothetical protein
LKTVLFGGVAVLVAAAALAIAVISARSEK